MMDERVAEIQAGMYQFSRAIYRAIKDLTDPYVDAETQLGHRRAVLEACEDTMERLASDPHYFANPDRTLFQDIRRYFPITQQAQVAWAVTEGIGAAAAFIQAHSEAGALPGARAPRRGAARVAPARRERAGRARALRLPRARPAPLAASAKPPGRRASGRAP